MQSQTDGAPPTQKPPSAIHPEGLVGVPDYYINAVAAHASLTDLALVVGRREIPSSGRTGMEALAVLRFGPPHLKQVAVLLSRMVENYESKFGPIPTGVAIKVEETLEDDAADANLEPQKSPSTHST